MSIFQAKCFGLNSAPTDPALTEPANAAGSGI
ncbi:hypothetical protein B0G84_8652 [Paraburkholderia sp. BL8N3]|nr:hypothetical protein B0G84_8652 [Paraburkholderia sp. BL8N3]